MNGDRRCSRLIVHKRKGYRNGSNRVLLTMKKIGIRNYIIKTQKIDGLDVKD